MRAEELTLRGIFEILKRRWKAIFGFTVMITGIVAVLNFYVLVPVYESSMSVIIGQSINGQDGEYDIEDVTMYLKAMETYVVIAESKDVAIGAGELLYGEYSPEELMDMIMVIPQSNTQIMEIKIRTENKKEAKKIVEAVTQSFKENAETLIPKGSVSIFENPVVPEKPVKPNKLLNILLAFIISFVGISGLIYSMYLLNTTIKNRDEGERATKLPVIGTIPKDNNYNRNKHTLIVRDQPESSSSEAFRILRTNIQYSFMNEDIKTIVVTSSIDSEGKSSIICNLALTISHCGKKVLIVDSDMRNPSIHKKFRLTNNVGLAQVLQGEVDKKEAIRKSGDYLHILTSGELPTNPSEILDSIEMKEFIDNVKLDYDFVFMDTPSLNNITDAQIISNRVDGALIVVGINEVDRDSLIRTKELLMKARANILGLVVNKN
ncbi:tyrosine-protein kinase domain-containing protein [Clostridium sp. DL1XJH146]